MKLTRNSLQQLQLKCTPKRETQALLRISVQAETTNEFMKIHWLTRVDQIRKSLNRCGTNSHGIKMAFSENTRSPVLSLVPTSLDLGCWHTLQDLCPLLGCFPHVLDGWLLQIRVLFFHPGQHKGSLAVHVQQLISHLQAYIHAGIHTYITCKCILNIEHWKYLKTTRSPTYTNINIYTYVSLCMCV